MSYDSSIIEQKKIVELSEMLKAIAHPSRIYIMLLLCKEPNTRMTVKSIYEKLNMAQPVISRHLGILRNNGLVTRMAEGSNTFYELNKANRNAKQISKCFTSFK